MGEQQTGKRISQGECSLCHATFNKAAMTRHLASCKERATVSETPVGKPRPKKAKIYHLVVEGRYLPEYWLHLEAPADATLGDLDHFLRNIWLECCAHLSAFTIEGMRYTSSPEPSFFAFDDFEEEGMDVELAEVLRPKMKFHYEYDFGTTTDLTLKVVAEREGEFEGKRIQLLARNEPPPIVCVVCGKNATKVCSQCVYSGEGWFCGKCARKHECGEEMLLPVVNSPRVGMCGYMG